MGKTAPVFLLLTWPLIAATADSSASLALPYEATNGSETAAHRTATLVEQRISAPLIGYLLHADEVSIQPLQGIPGAAVGGPQITLNRHTGILALSSTADYVAAAGGPGELIVYSLHARSGSGVVPYRSHSVGLSADRVVVSPLGTSALVYDRTARKVVIVRGLPGHSIPSAEIRIDSLPGVLTGLAVADGGNLALVAVASKQAAISVYLLHPSAALERVASVEELGALTFVPRRSDALVADSRRSEILFLHRGGTAGVTRVAGPENGLRSPSSVATFTDGTIVALDSSVEAPLLLQPGQPSRRINCQCRSVELERLSYPDAFRLTAPDALAVTVLEHRGGETAVYHIPIGLSEVDGSPTGDTSPAPGRRRGL